MQPTINTAAGQKQELCPRLTLEYLHNGKIWTYTFGRRSPSTQGSSRSVIDVWVNSVKDQVAAMAPGVTWYRLNDFSQTHMNPSPYFVTKLSEIGKHRPDLSGYSAYVIPQNIFTQVIQNLTYRIPRPGNIKTHLFFTRGEALAWLEDHLMG
jgi:hypothetical protein